LKQIAFTLYDMNSDGAVCEYDLFSIIRHTDNKMFIESINQDIRDIRAAMDNRISEMQKLENNR
jgi:Ca2+-binding EF-hand superfamily protein